MYTPINAICKTRGTQITPFVKPPPVKTPSASWCDSATDSAADPDADPTETISASCLIASTLFLMSAYSHCHCPKLAKIIAAHLDDVAAHPDTEATVKAMCKTIRADWHTQRASCMVETCIAESHMARPRTAGQLDKN